MTPNVDDLDKGDLLSNTNNNNNNTSNSSTIGNNNLEFSYVHSAVRTPPPPGFSLDNKASFYGNNRDGAGSAPPRSLISDGLGLGNGYSSHLGGLGAGGQGGQGFDGHDRLRMMLRPAGDTEKGRSSSFANLAAVLGEGLAESMGDSLVDLRNGHKMSRLPEEEPEPIKISNSNHISGVKNGDHNRVDMGIDNFARQSRHSLSHLVGSSSGLAGVDPRDLIHQMTSHDSTSANSTRDSTALHHNQHQQHNHHMAYTSHPQNGTALRSAKVDGNVVTVVEPSTPSPAPHQIRMNLNHKDVTRSMVHLNPGNTHFGRSSAPPQVFDNNSSSHLFGTNSAVLRQQTASSLQQRAAELRGLQKQADASPAHTPIPSFANAPSIIQRPPTVSPHPQQDQVMETQHELRPFIWSANTVSSSQTNFSSNLNSPSRALAIFGVSQLPVSEIRSTCEAFGSLLYFRSEFSSYKNVIFIAYHDIRSALHASNELKTYLQRIASSSLNEFDAIKCIDALKVTNSVCLTASSQHDESALLFSNVPYGIDKETVGQLTSSFGAVRSIYQHTSEQEATSGACYVVCFYDIQDANQCILEIQSTMPWGSMVKIRPQERVDSERKRSQDFLSLLSNWRMNSRSPAPSAQNNIPNNIAAARRISAASSPTTSAASSAKFSTDENTGKVQTPPTISTTESTTPPISFIPPTPQLVVGPDGQYSYVIVQPQGFQAPPPAAQYIQPGILPPAPMPAPQYVFDGQNYWLQHPPPPVREHTIPNAHSHVQTFHQMPNASVPISYPVMPVYPVANPGGNIHTDSSLSSGGSHNHSYAANVPNAAVAEVKKENNGKADNSNQRNVLDIEAVKQGWDVRTSLMIRNIPNKYTRSMLLAEFKECGHGPGKLDFFYLPIDFRNKCNRGYAFVNFVDYRSIVSFHLAYNGKGWKTFKSDKICEITYARIQGKMSMLKRFQNSALMDKDPEYRPVVFNADGEIFSPDDTTIS